MADYRQKAEQYTNPGYQNQLSDINANYAKLIQQTKDNMQTAKNNFSNNTLSRGLGRSSIATTGLSGIESAANKQVGDYGLEQNRAVSKLNNERESQMQQLMGAWQQRDEDYARQLAAARASRSYSGSSQAASEKSQRQQLTNAAWATFNDEFNAGTADKYLKQHGNEIITNLGYDAYNQMVDRLNKYQDQFDYNKRVAQIDNMDNGYRVSGGGRSLIGV